MFGVDVIMLFADKVFDAAILCERLQLKPNEVVCLSVYEHGTTLQLEPEVLMRVVRSFKTFEVEPYWQVHNAAYHVRFVAGGVSFSCILRENIIEFNVVSFIESLKHNVPNTINT